MYEILDLTVAVLNSLHVAECVVTDSVTLHGAPTANRVSRPGDRRQAQ